MKSSRRNFLKMAAGLPAVLVVPPTATRAIKARPVGNVPRDQMFSNFVVGPNSEAAHASIWGALVYREAPRDLIYLIGPAGMGKTHLLRALENEERRLNPKAKMLFTSGERFINEYVVAKKSEKYRQKFDFLFIDDIEPIQYNLDWKNEFLATLEFHKEIGTQVLLASDERLDLVKGHVAEIQKMDRATTEAIVRYKAYESGLDLCDKSIAYIIDGGPKSVRELEASLLKIELHAGVNKELLNYDLVKKVLRAAC